MPALLYLCVRVRAGLPLSLFLYVCVCVCACVCVCVCVPVCPLVLRSFSHTHHTTPHHTTPHHACPTHRATRHHACPPPRAARYENFNMTGNFKRCCIDNITLGCCTGQCVKPHPAVLPCHVPPCRRVAVSPCCG